MRRPSFAPAALAVLLAALTVSSSPASLRAQAGADGAAVPVAGDWTLAASLFEPDTGSLFGIGRMLTDRLAVGLELDLRDTDSEETLESNITTRGQARSTDHTIGPTLRWYGSRDTPVSPYLRAKMAFGWDDDELIIQGDQQQYQDLFTLQASLSLGAEWYALRYLSVSGQAGIQWRRDTVDSAANGVSRDRSTTTWGTFRSGLALNFWFR